MGCQGSKDKTARAVAVPVSPSPGETTLSAAELSYFSTANILRSALVAAVRTRDAALVDAILTKKPAFRHNRIGDASLVLSSCADASVELLRVLLRHGASADDGLADGVSALHLAVMTNQVRVVELLVAHGADVNAATRIPQQPLDGLTPLHLAVRRGLVDVATALLESGRVDLAREDPDGFTAVQAAVARPAGLPVLRLLHSLGFVENLTSDSAGKRRDVPLLVLAIRPGYRETVEFLLKAGERDGIVNAAARDSAVTPLMVAAAEGLLDLVQVLIAHGANVNAVRISEPIHSTALFEAAFEGHDQVVEALLRAGARHDVRTGDNGMTPLHAASSHGHVRCVELLCGAGADVNSQSRRDRTPRANSNIDDQLTPAHLAAFDGHHQVIDVLVANGANVDACSARGETPLMLAATHGQAALVAHLLFTYKVDVHRRDRSGSNALHKAVAMGHVDAARVLLMHGADANAVLSSPRRESPLHIVAATGSSDVASVLMALGADPHLEDSEGNTPAQIAEAHGHHALAVLLNKKTLEGEVVILIVPSPVQAG